MFLNNDMVKLFLRRLPTVHEHRSSVGYDFVRQWAIIVPLAFIVFCIIEGLKWAFKKGEDAYDAKMEAKKAALVAAGKGYDLAA